LAAPIPDDVKKVVTLFLLMTQRAASFQTHSIFVGIKDSADPQRTFVYLATARHVISTKPFGPLYPHVYVRLAKRSGGTEIVKIPLVPGGPQPTVFLHPDPSVDLAVIPALPSQDVFDFRVIPDDFDNHKAAI